MRNLVSSALAAFVWCSLLISSQREAKAQSGTVNPQTAAALQTKLDNLRTSYNVKGLSASVIIPGMGTWNGVSGISHAGVPIDTAMAFGMGGITQNLTAAAILLLQDDGYLSLSDSLREFLPPYPNIDPNITIRMLLQHTSGIYNYFANPTWFNAINSNPSQAMTADSVLNYIVSPPYFAPGTGHEFSHTNYVLLGKIIEQVTGQSAASYIRQRLLDPLQLSSLYARDHEPEIGVMSHHWSPNGPGNPGSDITSIPLTAIAGTSPASVALFGTPHDMARWGHLLFSGQVLPSFTLMMMTQFMPVNLGPITGYGLGLNRYGSGNTELWGNNGNIRGFQSSLIFSPTDSIVVSISSNQPSMVGPAFSLATELLGVAQQQLVTAAPHELADSRDALSCYPNPVQGKGGIRYSLEKAQPVKITLQNSLGQIVQTLLSEFQPAGAHSLTVDTRALASGVYFCTLQTSDSKQVQRWVITE